MLAFLAGRLLWAVLLVGVIITITFALFIAIPPNAPGSNRQGQVAPNLQTQFKLGHKSMPRQYVLFLDRLVRHGDLGRSLRQPRSVRTIIRTSLPVTTSLVIGGTVFWLLLAFPIGMLSALRPRSALDKGLMFFVLIGVSVHPIALGLMLSYLLGFRLHLFPVAGYCDLVYDPKSPNLCGGPRFWAYHMVLPWFTFALLFAALYARMIRAGILEVLSEDYVRTAWAKGAGRWRVLRRHVLKNALLPVISMLGMDLALAFGGTVFIETAYGLPGMGQVLFRALTSSDLPVIMGEILIVSIAVTIGNTLADIVYCAVDPRLGFRKRRLRSFSGALQERPPVRPPVTESPR
ncbi:MAG: ABC transporter permease [Actinomycetota bacterium]